ncbi:hypothetical protein [Vibrio owensii]|uniref:hypothetical protein n=1 Tax=Vibrio owensii TaxID=696485 RepID=UPI0038CD7BAA
MEQLVRFFSGQLPAFWGAILAFPLIQTNFPELLELIKIDNVHVIVALVIWLVVYEISVVHIVTPLFLFIMMLIGLYVPIYRKLVKYIPYEKLKSKVEETQFKRDNPPDRVVLARRLVRKHMAAVNPDSLSDRYVDDLAIFIGEQEIEKKKEPNDRGAMFTFSLALTSIVSGFLYIFFPPSLGYLGLNGIYIGIGLVLLSIPVILLGFVFNAQEGEEKINLAIIRLSEVTKD